MINGLLVNILLEKDNNFTKMTITDSSFKKIYEYGDDKTPYIILHGFFENIIKKDTYNVYAEYKIGDQIKIIKLTDIDDIKSFSLDGFGFDISFNLDDNKLNITFKVDLKNVLFYIF